MLKFNLYKNRSLEGKVDLVKYNFPDVSSRVLIKSVKYQEPVFRGFKKDHPFTVTINLSELNDIINHNSIEESFVGNIKEIMVDMDNPTLIQGIENLSSIRAIPDKVEAKKFAVKTNTGFVNARTNLDTLKNGLLECLHSNLFGANVFGHDLSVLDPLDKTLIIKTDDGSSNINIKESGIQILSGDGAKSLEVNDKQTVIDGDTQFKGEIHNNSPIFFGIPEKENDMNSLFPSSNLALMHLNKIIRIIRIVTIVQTSVSFLSKVVSLASSVVESNTYDNAINNIQNNVSLFKNRIESNLITNQSSGDLVQSSFRESAKILKQDNLLKNLDQIKNNQ